MWPLRSIAFFIGFWGACTASIANPIWGVINYMMIYQVDPRMTWWGEPVTRLGIRFSLLAVLFTLIGSVVGRKVRSSFQMGISPWEMGVLAIVFFAGVNMWVGIGRTFPPNYMFEKLWKSLLFVVILGRLATTRENLRLVIWCLVFGTLYIGYDAYTAPYSAFVSGRLDRIGGPDFATTSAASAHLSAMLPIVGIAFMCAKKWRWRAVAAVSGALAFNTIIMCRTRAAFIGLAFGSIVALLMTPKVRRTRIRMLLLLGGLAAFTLTDGPFWTRMATLTNRETLAADPAAVSRINIWMISLDILRDHPFGIGPGNFTKIIGDYDFDYYKRSTHNSIVTCFVELGYQGGIIFLFIVGLSVWMLWRSSHLAHLTRNPIETKIMAYGLVISLTTYFVTAQGTRRFYAESFWWVLVLPLCLYRMVQGEVTESACALEPVDEPASARKRPTTQVWNPIPSPS